MKKVIGIVSEGPTDYMVIKAAIDRITGEENRYLSLQPEPDMMGRYGNGWKGVWRWCKETPSINMLMQEVHPGFPKGRLNGSCRKSKIWDLSRRGEVS